MGLGAVPFLAQTYSPRNLIAHPLALKQNSCIQHLAVHLQNMIVHLKWSLSLLIEENSQLVQSVKQPFLTLVLDYFHLDCRWPSLRTSQSVLV